ncbi:MAG TPA: thermonuclease family protein [Methylomirabilota bacterium]|jgi:micrococcal nuclease|nr:thermonuclease family protein [Methylomirabilota bacterium]
MLQLAALVGALLFAVSAGAETYSARVVAVMEGDTVRVLHGARQVVVRLRWIDAPEEGQAFGREAKQALVELTARQIVLVRDYGRDRSGRRLAELILPDGRNVNRELVRAGWAWWFRKYSKDRALGTLEAEARASRRGLWADPHPIAPWEWRAAKGRP